MKKTLTISALFILLITGGLAISVDDIQVSPSIPEHNDSVNVTAYVDGEEIDTNSVDVDVRENGTLIAEDVPMALVSGSTYGLGGYKASDVFTTIADENNSAVYDLTVQAIDGQGNQDSGTLRIELDKNGTVIEEIEDETSNELFGIQLVDLLVVALIVLFAYAMFTE